LLALGPGAAAWLTTAASHGTQRLRAKMRQAVEFAAVYGDQLVDGALATAAEAGRFAEGDLGAILRHQRHTSSQPSQVVHINEAQSLPARDRPLEGGEPMTATSQELEAEVDRLAGRLRLPYLRRAAAEVIPTGRSQRWDPGEVLRAVLAEEAAGRDAAGLANRRRRAGFPTGKTFDSWDTDASSVPTATEQALRSLEWIRRAENLAVIGPSGTKHVAPAGSPGPRRRRRRPDRDLVQHPRPRPAGAPPPRRRQRRQGHPTGDPRRPDRHR
jgi:hypothetical protein